MWLIPWSKVVSSLIVDTFLLTFPIKVSIPVFTTTPKPFPLITLVPIKHIFLIAVSSLLIIAFCPAIFSIAILSPVKDAWLINKSLLSIKYKSAGTIEPALKVIISPSTIFSCLTSCCFSLRMTSVKIFIFSLSLTLKR